MAQADHNSAVRNSGLDNLRAVLMICVVLGHLLEICVPFRGSILLYRVIYAFHMPAFLFLTGYFARFSLRRILRGYVFPYILFQPLYIWFSRAVLHGDTPFRYTTPYWILWYLLVCIYYHLLLPLFDTDKPKKQVLFLFITVFLALGAGFVGRIGYFASLSRFFVFQPWFLLGFYLRKHASAVAALSARTKCISSVVCAAVLLCSLCFLRNPDLPDGLLHGSYSYAALGIPPYFRLIAMGISLCWIVLLYLVFTGFLNRKLPLLTTLGQNTLPPFLLHGFLIKLIAHYVPVLCSNPAFVLLSVCGILLLLGNPWPGRIFRTLFR